MTTRALTVLILAASSAAALACSPVASARPAPSDKASLDESALPIRKITLYRSGVGYFERSAAIDGSAGVQLRFSTDQINDILKSMVLLDLDGGRIDSVSYASKEPLERRLASFGVDISDNPSITDLLVQLRGAPVKVVVAGSDITGTVLGVEERLTAPDKDKPTINVPHLNLVTPTGLRSIASTDISSFEILDKSLADELSKALAAIAEYRADRTKTVDLSFTGNGRRRVVVGYVHEMPVWKTSYRLVLPDSDPAPGAAGSLVLQGWAIVENTTDQDWKDVQLGLVSGRPVSFQMDLYEPLFSARPLLPVPTIPGVAPRIYALGMDEEERLGRLRAGRSPELALEQRSEGAEAYGLDDMAAARPPMSRMMSMMPGRAGHSADDLVNYAAAAQARAAEIGELFQFQVQAPVSIERQRSAMIPILSTNVSGRRVSIFNTADGAEHPMRGVELSNDSGLPLLPGPISVLDGAAYAGDAQIGQVPRGDKRFLSYAIDMDVAVITKPESDRTVSRVKLVNGAFQQSVKYVNTFVYEFGNKDAKRGRTIIVEHPKLAGDGWTLVGPDKPTEQTQNLHRFTVAVEPGKAATLRVVQERTAAESVGVSDFGMNTVLAYHRDGKLSDAVLSAFRDYSARQAEIAGIDREITSIEKQVQIITAEQSRIRDNMGAIERTSQLYATYMSKLTAQETQLDELATRKLRLTDDALQKRNALTEFFRTLNVE